MASDFAAVSEFAANAPPHDQQTTLSANAAKMYRQLRRGGISGLGCCCGLMRLCPRMYV